MTKLTTTALLLWVGLCGGATAVARADTVSLLLDVGLLKNGTGTALEPAGGLLQLLASPSGRFAPPTSAGYAAGDNVLLRSFAMNDNSGVNGETVNALYSVPFVTPAYTVTAGEPVLLRFYPGLTYAGMPAAPPAAAAYGQVRSDAVEFGPAGGDASETPWVLPAGGSLVDMDYITRSDGGTYADATAYAAAAVRRVLTAPTLPIASASAVPHVYGLTDDDSGVSAAAAAAINTPVPEPTGATLLAAAAVVARLGRRLRRPSIVRSGGHGRR